MPFNQRIPLAEIAPDDPSWEEASPAIRLAFAREAGDRLVAIKKDELRRGVGADGRRMALRKHPRPDRASGPVLTPHRAASRTVRLMAAHAAVDRVTLFWRSGHGNAQRTPWGTILGFHADGKVKGAPVRDVRTSRKGRQRLKVGMREWWTRNYAAKLGKARERRLAAEARERLKAVPRVAKRAVDAMAKRYRSLAAYLKPRGGGF